MTSLVLQSVLLPPKATADTQAPAIEALKAILEKIFSSDSNIDELDYEGTSEDGVTTYKFDIQSHERSWNFGTPHFYCRDSAGDNGSAAEERVIAISMRNLYGESASDELVAILEVNESFPDYCDDESDGTAWGEISFGYPEALAAELVRTTKKSKADLVTRRFHDFTSAFEQLDNEDKATTFAELLSKEYALVSGVALAVADVTARAMDARN
jgi:hypothetical protein